MKKAIASVQIKEAPISDGGQYWVAVVETLRARCFYAIYAGEKPSPEKVAQDYRDDGGPKSPNWSPYLGQ